MLLASGQIQMRKGDGWANLSRTVPLELPARFRHNYIPRKSLIRNLLPSSRHNYYTSPLSGFGTLLHSLTGIFDNARMLDSGWSCINFRIGSLFQMACPTVSTAAWEGTQLTYSVMVAHDLFRPTPPMSFSPEALPHAIGQLMLSWATVPFSPRITSEPLAVLGPVGSLIHAGGPVIVVLLGMSVLALTVTTAKLWQFASLELNRLQTVRHMLALHLEGESTQALSVARRCRNPAAAVLAQAIRGQYHHLPTAMVREDVERASHALVVSLRANLRLLEVTASLAPLLGLLGTVLGMIEAFQQIAQAESAINPSTLSGGIWEALLTTAAGLSVAIPVVAVLNWLEGCVEHFTHELTDLTTRVFTTDLSRDQQHDLHPPANRAPSAVTQPSEVTS